MSQQRRLIQPSLAGAIFLCLLAGIFLAVWKRSSKPEESGSSVKHSVDTPAEEALKYWTRDKMRKAKPARMPHVDTPDQEKPRPPHTPRPHTS